MNRILLVFGVAMVFAPPPGQKEDLGPYKQLTAADFRLDNVAHPEVAIYTECYLRYKYKADVQPKDGGYVAKVSQWTVLSGLDRGRSTRKSWLQDIESILPHEQGHLDINEIHARTLTKAELPTGEGATEKAAWKNLDGKVQKLVDDTAEADRQEQAAYDRETMNGRMRIMQGQWQASLRQRMAKLGITR